MSDKNWSTLRQRVKDSNPAPAPKQPEKKATKATKPPFELEPIVAFYIFLASNVVAAIYSPIQDCDEVFNYWEPTHYLNHRYGFQTWEYSPEYAIRSWAYVGLHATIVFLSKLIPLVGVAGKKGEFYILRVALGFTCAVCETRFYSKISKTLNPRIAIIFMLVMTTSPGLFHASIAYLPSSFAMYTTMLAMGAFMDWRGGLRTAQGILFVAIGACIGWPFAAAMSIPFLLEELMLATLSSWQGQKDLFWRLVDGVGRGLIVLIAQIVLDTTSYKTFAAVPLNIVLYNVFGSNGPDLYGTEPWHFYLRNLFLNFHFWLVLALLSMPLLLAQHALGRKGATKASYLRGVVFLSPFYLWLAIFTLQPHKEERFMYPAYPALALNASVAFHIILANLGSSDPKDLVSKIPVKLRLFAILSFVILSLGLSAFRTIGTMTAYGAPLSIYSPLRQRDMTIDGNTLCLGKEWYRFPSHHLLPADMRAKFIKSEFSGLLPGEFSEAIGFGVFPGTWLLPSGMNDENREDLGKYTDIRQCDFIVDSNLPSTVHTKLEPNFIEDREHWEQVRCLPFLDAASTGILGRLGWIPDLPIIPAKYRRVWGAYCLLKRKTT